MSPSSRAGEVDLVIASYSITDERRQVVGQAGPYYVTGQQLLVGADSDIQSVDDIKGQEVCSVTGSTSLDNVKAEGAKPRGFDTYSECVDQVLDGTVDAMTTDGAILLGYVAEHPDELEGRRRPVLRGALRHRLLQGQPGDVRVDQRHARQVVRRRHLGRTRSTPRSASPAWRRRSSPTLDECQSA